MRELEKKAKQFAYEAHKGMKRKGKDTPFTYHLKLVNLYLESLTDDEEILAAGGLHDVIEDTPLNAEFLREKGIDDDVLNILSFLTHDKEKTTYSDYIDNICNNVDAMLVKLSDLTDNLDQGTLSVITDRDRERFIVYENARTKIMSTLARDYPETFKEIMKTGN